MHILHNRHEFGPAEETLKILKPFNKGTKINFWEALYMNMHRRQGLIPEQVTDTNPLFDLAIIARDLQTPSPHSSSQHDAAHTHTTGSVQVYFCFFFLQISNMAMANPSLPHTF
jgi:hypothetical protein